MELNFDDSAVRESLYPFTATRNAADIRVGILTIREKWKLLLEREIIDPAILPAGLKANIVPAKDSACFIVKEQDGNKFENETFRILKYPWQIFQLNDWALREDHKLLTEGRQSQPIPASNSVISADQIFIEEGAFIQNSILNASSGPIYIGKGATVMEGCMIRGPFALCEGSVLKMGSKVYGATTIGPYCVAGGEIKNSVIFGYSNKAHDGYLGDSVIGEWCNLGAGTTNSNVLNTAGNVKLWHQDLGEYFPIGLKCGLLMGDYSRAAINTSFNTGTIVGVCCNIFGPEYPAKLVNDFTWGKERYTFDKALDHIDNWKKLKGQQITEQETSILKQLYTNLKG